MKNLSPMFLMSLAVLMALFVGYVIWSVMLP